MTHSVPEKCDGTSDLLQRSEINTGFLLSHCAFVTETNNWGSLFERDLMCLAS